ncbi:hypothetical protein K1T71_011981 [Dendrolimus kikuchii]|uniref:Uncharacterized protein n=1 Tax=Dendrolimus kikuchii TaxID=765133 RepID=A0ACC1CMZ2_9NEOP|nr:hypothetical protein K1T71_011981 [Dendrolimus kikuchii]
MEEVAASMRSAPALSLRARASVLRVPHTTLHTILQKDLPNLALKNKESNHSKVQNKQQSTRRVKKQMKKTKSKIFEQTQCTGNLPMSATDDLHIATHYLPPHALNTIGYTT